MLDRPCVECKDFEYEDQYQKPMSTNKKRIGRDGKPKRRAPNGRPPCYWCPKKSPENEKNLILSNKNLHTINVYFAVKGTGWRLLDERALADDILVDNLAAIDEVMRAHEQAKMAEMLGSSVVTGVSASMPRQATDKRTTRKR